MAAVENMAGWLKDFERAFDEFFDDALPARWRRAGDWQDAVVRDCGRHYEIELAANGVEPEGLSVEVVGYEVMVRDRNGQAIGRFAFPAPIDADAVRARWSNGVLLIAVPKRLSRRVPVERPR
jgi:HSP20 family molecular chaperone IbpA